MKNQITALDLIKKIKKEVEHTIISREQMIFDLKMMNLRIRQLGGNVSLLEKVDNQIIESLWKLGKIDQIMSSEFNRMNETEKDIFLRYLSFIQEEHRRLVDQTYRNLPPQEKGDVASIELEISRIDPSYLKKRAN